jgi:hypothetical protein
LFVSSATAYARDAHVTAITPTTAYIDAGTADGLAAGASWQATIGGRLVAIRVVAVATHDAVVELDGAPPPVGSSLALPAGLVPATLVVPKPLPPPLPPWRGAPQAAMADVRHAAEGERATLPATSEPIISGELALTALLAADTSNSSTSLQDLSLSSQLSIASGPWHYDHLIDAHLVAAPELFTAPLQHAQARFDVYQLRLEYSPADARFAAAVGRQPGAPLSELGTVDGARGRVALDSQFDVSAFAGLRPAADLGFSLAPRAGADLGWQYSAVDGTRARADAGVAIDEYSGHLDRTLAALSGSYANRRDLAHVDASFDFSSDAFGQSGPRLTRAVGLARTKRGRLTTSIEAGYDRPFVDRALAAEVPDLVAPTPTLLLGPRTYAGGGATYALRRDLDVGGSVRASTGDGFTSGYFDLLASWYDPAHVLRVTAVPHAIVGSLTDDFGLRGTVTVPVWDVALDLGGSLDRIYAVATTAWAGFAHVGASYSFYQRWRTALSAEVAAGDGPPRMFLFALLGYRL